MSVQSLRGNNVMSSASTRSGSVSTVQPNRRASRPRCVSTANLCAGLCAAAAERVRGLVQRVGHASEITATGGGALNVGLVRALEQVLGAAINVPERPQLAGALGAALLGWESCHAPV